MNNQALAWLLVAALIAKAIHYQYFSADAWYRKQFSTQEALKSEKAHSIRNWTLQEWLLVAIWLAAAIFSWFYRN